MPLILPSNSISAVGYEVDNSLRFDSASSDYLSRTPASSGNRKTFTFSAWVKRSGLSGATDDQVIFGANTSNGSNDEDALLFNPSNNFRLVFNNQNDAHVRTNAVFRDVSAWYHLVASIDTTQATASNRVKLYVNGEQVTSLASTSYPSQNYDCKINNTVIHGVGRLDDGGGSATFIDGYMAEVVFIDGQQLDPTSFGEFDADSGIWKPKAVSGLTFGTNGFYLDFENSGSLGADVSGNGNNFTVNNLTSIDQTTDTPTNNYCTMNPLNVPTSNQPTFSEGNLKTVSSSSPSGAFGGSTTFGVSQGKWYVEAKATVDSTYSRNAIGVTYNPAEMARSNADTQISNTSYAWGWESSGGEVRHDGSVVASYATYGTGDICQIFLDLDNHKLYFGKNGSLQSSTGISLDTGETYFIVQTDRTGSSATSTFEFNFGNPIYSISSSNTDGEYGNFEYSTTITGDGASKTFKALNTKNLAEYG
jgi:hypothetical protein